MLFSLKEGEGWRVDLRRAPRGKSLRSLRMPISPLEINWYDLYRNRQELERRWSNYSSAGLSADLSDDATLAEKEVAKAWEPKVMRISGHGDRCATSCARGANTDLAGMCSVYCLEFDSSRIITGSRDRTIKVWSLKTGKCLATFVGHRGSVLCLKFDRDWDVLDESAGDVDPRAPRKGFMVSGSSDSTVCVWDLYAHYLPGEDEPRITAEVRAILHAHSGGVLDLRIDQQWIVSW